MTIDYSSARRRTALCVLLALFVTSQVVAETTFTERRILRTEAFAPADLPSRGKRAPEAVGWTLASTVGLAYTDVEAGGHIWNAPFDFSWTNGANRLSVQSDGYADISGAGSVSGFSDVLLLARHTWADEAAGQKFSFSLGATIPVGGDIGTTKTKERITAGFTKDLAAKTSLTITASLRRSEASASNNANPYSQVIGAQLTKEFGKKDVFIQMVSAHPNNGDWASTVVLGHDFPLTSDGKLVGSISLSRGVGSGAKDTAVEFDISW